MDYKDLHRELDCHRPLFFFHDDPDGLCSFLLLYRFVGEGKGIVVKSSPSVDIKFVSKVKEYHPDKIFILDLAMVDDEFLQEVSTPIVWIDHHAVQDARKTMYFNPRMHSRNIPVSLVCYKMVQKDLWIAMVGIVADWVYHAPTAKKFSEEYPDLLPLGVSEPGAVLFETPIGRLARIFSFVLKGKTDDALKCVRVLTRIDDPREILDQTTSRGRFVYARYAKIAKEYESLLDDSVKSVSDDDFLVFVYPGSRMSFTRDLCNELLHRYPDKVVVTGREKSGEVKLSVSARKPVLPAVQKSLEGFDGYGGGHEHACGVVVKSGDFQAWLAAFRKFMDSG